MKKHKKPPVAFRIAPNVLEKVRERAVSFAEPHGLLIHKVTFGQTDLGWTLSVVVASADGKALSVTDCEIVARPLSKELDDLLDDRTPAYMFEVTSVGVELSESLESEEN